MKSQVQRKNVILDLDQTVISGESYDELDAMNQEELEVKLTQHKHSDMKGYYKIFERPGLQEFLDYLFANFTVSVWTAASKEYALFIIKHIIIAGKKKKRVLDYILFAHHCEQSQDKYESIKNLCMLWKTYKLKGYRKRNTMIIDDNNEVSDTQPANCIHIKPFKFKNKKSHTDKILAKVVRPLLDIFRDK